MRINFIELIQGEAFCVLCLIRRAQSSLSVHYAWERYGKDLLVKLDEEMRDARRGELCPEAQ